MSRGIEYCLSESKEELDRLVASCLIRPASVLERMIVAYLPGTPVNEEGYYYEMRLGRDGQLFTFPKIRTMRSVEQSVPIDRNKRSQRILPKAGIFRDAGLDELPQLKLVQVGVLSMVGPRSLLPDDVERHMDLARDQGLAKDWLDGVYLSVRHGLVGPGEHCRVYHDDDDHTSIEARMRAEISYYRKDATLQGDIGYILRTPGHIAAGAMIRRIRRFADAHTLQRAA